MEALTKSVELKLPNDPTLDGVYDTGAPATEDDALVAPTPPTLDVDYYPNTGGFPYVNADYATDKLSYEGFCEPETEDTVDTLDDAALCYDNCYCSGGGTIASPNCGAYGAGK